MEHKITVVGIGPGSPDYILPIAKRIIDSAHILVGSQRALDTFAPSHAVTKVIDKDIAGVVAFIRQQLIDNAVVVMVSGDPGYYSLLVALRRHFTPEQITVIPGISSVQVAFARLALPWQDATLISMHGRKPECDAIAYQPGRKLGILTDTVYRPSQIAKILLNNGWPAEASVWLCANLSYDDEQVITASLQEIMAMEGFSHCVMVVAA